MDDKLGRCLEADGTSAALLLVDEHPEIMLLFNGVVTRE